MPRLSFPASILFLRHTVPFTNTWRPFAPGETDSGSSSRVSADRTYYTPAWSTCSPPEIPGTDSSGVGAGAGAVDRPALLSGDTGVPGRDGPRGGEGARTPGSSRSLPASGRAGGPGPRGQGGGVVRTPLRSGRSVPRGGRGGSVPEGSPEGGHAWPWTPVPSTVPASQGLPPARTPVCRKGLSKARVPRTRSGFLFWPRHPLPSRSGRGPSAPPHPAVGPAPAASPFPGRPRPPPRAPSPAPRFRWWPRRRCGSWSEPGPRVPQAR